MNCTKVGELISSLRKEKRFTQKDLASRMHISDKAISKWERGLGCPDVTLLKALSEILGVDIASILSGDLRKKRTDVGNMKRMMFYECKQCKNILTSTSHTEISCCGRPLEALVPQKMDKDHNIRVTEIEQDLYVELDHPMTKGHSITFLAQLSYDKVFLAKLYPEQDAAVRIPIMRGSRLFAHCSEHGLWVKE